MTAEVSVMNQIGVALAADSAVTIGHQATKIYTTADKLFQLSESAPVGVMIYGGADYCHLPWETIIKAFRKKLGDTQYSTLDEYGREFTQFLSSPSNLLPTEPRIQCSGQLIFSFLEEVYADFEATIDEAMSHGHQIDTAHVEAVFQSKVEEIAALVATYPYVKSIDAAARRRIKSKLRNTTSEYINTIFEKIPRTSRTESIVRNAALEMLLREVPSPSSTGLVFAGFGESEYLPGLLHYRIDGMAYVHPRDTLLSSSHISNTRRASVQAFAQQDMVKWFMEGIQDEMFKYIQESTRTTFSELLNVITTSIAASHPNLSNQFQKTIGPAITPLLESLFQSWKDSKQEFVEPVMDIVETLPKGELAAMAESLVNLTKFRRKVTNVRETVGGPIDVAVITKGDGFVWVQRKHYFSPDLNPRVISRMKRGKP